LLSSIPVLGELFKSKSFQKNETELMFIVTAHLVKPVDRDDLPQMRGIDGLKNGSPLGVEPKGEGITGKTGFSIANPGASSEGAAPVTAPKAAEPKKAETEPKTQEKKDSSTTTGDAVGAKSTRVNAPLPVRPMLADFLANAQPVPIP
jgi:pilus assembly protein CpaC